MKKIQEKRGDMDTDLMVKIKFLLFNYSKLEDVEEVGRMLNCQVIQRKRKKRILGMKRKILIAAVCVLIIAGGVAVVARQTGFFTRIFKPHEIDFTTDVKIQEPQMDYKHYTSIEEMLQDLKLSIPILTGFPDDLKTSNIFVNEINDRIAINCIYSDNDNVEMVKITYKYFDNPVDVDVKSGINDTYDYLGNFYAMDTVVDMYSDMERRLAIWSYDKFIIHVETRYTKEQLQLMIENIKF